MDSEITERGDVELTTLDALLATTYSRSQMYLSRQLAQLHPELTMPMFSGTFFLIRPSFELGSKTLPLRRSIENC